MYNETVPTHVRSVNRNLTNSTFLGGLMVKASLTHLIGKQFGRYTVLSINPNVGRQLLNCRCACGNERTVGPYELQKGMTRSCGCLKNEMQAARLTTHGLTKSPEYKIWRAIKDRCLNPKDKRYQDYGGRGIAVCDEWRDDFAAFLRDVGPRPSKDLSIDRLDNERGYEKGNVRWSTREQQAHNTRVSRTVEYQGQKYNLTALARLLGLNHGTFHYFIIKHGLSVEETIIRMTKLKCKK
jgi:hypothetical protein